MQTRLWLSIFSMTLFLQSACGSGAKSNEQKETITGPTPVVVRILDLNIDLEPSVDPDSSLVPPTSIPPTLSKPAQLPTESRTAGIQATQTPACINRAEFIKHLTVADNTAIVGGAPFTKIWQVKNSGTCTWTSEYSLQYYSGNSMNGPETLALTQSIAPGETYDFRLDLIAPLELSTYTGYWVIMDPHGQAFGLGEKGEIPLSVVIQVKPTPRPTPG